MSKLRSSSALAAAIAVGCFVPQERSILDRFFSASRLRDKTALASIATVIFEPLEQGIVTRFEVLGVSAANTAASKVVTISAPVKLPDGQVLEKTLHVTLELRSGRWIVTAVRM